ncbi:hypothetical protein [Rhizobium sp. BR 315]|uniref:hypothetical protein n=1 Tax=Rhizobium sp. BR 315 TaxID=3040014 RepID=UPI003D33DF56
MLADFERRSAFAQMSTAQRLARVDFVTAALAEIIQQMGGKYDGSVLSGLLYINRMLAILREDLAMVDDACNRAIVGQVQDLISVLRHRAERETLATANL